VCGILTEDGGRRRKVHSHKEIQESLNKHLLIIAVESDLFGFIRFGFLHVILGRFYFQNARSRFRFLCILFTLI
jgi:hypothetical protein